MPNVIFLKREAIKFGWQKMKENFLLFLPLSLLYIFLGILPIYAAPLTNILSIIFKGTGLYSFFNELNASILSLPHWVNYLGKFFGVLLAIVFVKICLKIAENQKVKFKDVFYQPLIFFKYLAAEVLFIIMFYLGLTVIMFVLLIFLISQRDQFVSIMATRPTTLIITVFIFVSLIVWLFMVRFGYWYVFAVTGNGPNKALKNSWLITKNHGWDLYVFSFCLFFINFLGFMIFGLGLIVTLPVTSMASIYVYNKLKDAYNESLSQAPLPEPLK